MNEGSNGSSPLLALEGVSAGYGPFRALFDVSLAVRERSVTALLGSNGAGKTTVARVCSGLVAPTSGRVLLDGEDVSGRPAYEFARRGVIHAVEGRSVFASLSVEENLVLTFRQALGKEGVEGAMDKAFDTFPRLGERRKQEAGTLSGGEQRMLSLARVLANPPRVLVADELSLGLAPIVVDEVYRVLQAIRETGASLLIVEQQVTRALSLADDVVLLGKGAVQYCGPAAGMADRAEQLVPGQPA
ncbi:MAG: ABC transporter ATP-binding protein [Actinomycetota bacterium]|nr:ABC transporter ATP-binding protein [Actinomycetota bacterium]